MNAVMKNFYRHINLAGIALLLILFSCSGGDGLPTLSGKQEGERIPLRVAGASTGIGIGVESRADDRVELKSGSIGIFLQKNVVNGYDAFTNLEFIYDTPFWYTAEQILLGEQNATLAAYYPYHDGRVNPVLLRSRRYDKDEDLHYVNFQANSTTAAVTLNLSRVYSCIVFNFNNSSGAYTGAGKVTAIQFEGDGIIPVALLDMFDLTVQNPGKSVRDILDPFTGLHMAEISGFTTQFTQTQPGAADCLMIPSQLQGDIIFTVTVDDAKMSSKVTATQLCGPDGILLEGVKYEINVTIRPKQLEINSIKKMEWEPIDVVGDYEIQ